MTTTPESIKPESVETPRNGASGKLLIAALMAIEVFAVFETSMAFAAVPTFIREFQVDTATVGWTATSYLLVGAAVAATAGRLGDIFGRRKILVIVLIVAVFGSLVSSLAPNLFVIVIGRGLQGFAAGALPLTFGIIREKLEPKMVPVAMALTAGLVPICAGLGAFTAGVLIDNSGWRAMFIAATILGVGAVLVARFLLPLTSGLTPRPRIDVLGGVLLVPASVGLLYGATASRAAGWGSPIVITSLLIGAIALAVWIWWERRTPEPMVNLNLFRNRKVVLATLATVAIGMGPMGSITLLGPLLLQLPKEAPIGLGLSVTAAGVLSLIQSFVSFFAAIAAGRIARSFGARWSLILGGTCGAIGVALWMLLNKDLVGSTVAVALVGASSGFAISALPILVVEAVPPANTAEATGVNRVTLNMAVAFGLAFVSLILASSTVPGTTLPTAEAAYSAMTFVIVASLIGVVLGLLIKRGAVLTAEKQENS
jgi:MFS family permease